MITVARLQLVLKAVPKVAVSSALKAVPKVVSSHVVTSAANNAASHLAVAKVVLSHVAINVPRIAATASTHATAVRLARPAAVTMHAAAQVIDSHVALKSLAQAISNPTMQVATQHLSGLAPKC